MACKLGVCFVDHQRDEAFRVAQHRALDIARPRRPAAVAERPRPAAVAQPAGPVVTPRPAAALQRPAAQRPAGAIDPDRAAACSRMYAELSLAAREQINKEFAGRPRNDANDAAWCDRVEQVYYAPPVRPAGRLDPFLSQAECSAQGGTYTAGGCMLPDAPQPTQPGQPGATRPGQQNAIASAEDCRARGGFVMGFDGGPQSCSFVNGGNFPIGTQAPERDNTQQIVQGIVGGVLGIAQVVGQVIGRNDQAEFARFMAGLQVEQARMEQASRQGDRDAALALGRIQQAIAEANAAAAQANAAAAQNNQPPPFPQVQQGVPTWVWVAGGVTLALAAVAVTYAVTSRGNDRGGDYGRDDRRGR